MNQPAVLVIDKDPNYEPLYHVYRNGEFVGEMPHKAMMAVVATFSGADRVMVYRLLRD